MKTGRTVKECCNEKHEAKTNYQLIVSKTECVVTSKTDCSNSKAWRHSGKETKQSMKIQENVVRNNQKNDELLCNIYSFVLQWMLDNPITYDEKTSSDRDLVQLTIWFFYYGLSTHCWLFKAGTYFLDFTNNSLFYFIFLRLIISLKFFWE